MALTLHSTVVIRMAGSDLDGRVGTVLELLPGGVVRVRLRDRSVRIIPRKFLR